VHLYRRRTDENFGVFAEKNLERLVCSQIVGKEKNSRSHVGVNFLVSWQVSYALEVCRKLIAAELKFDFRPLHKVEVFLYKGFVLRLQI